MVVFQGQIEGGLAVPRLNGSMFLFFGSLQPVLHGGTFGGSEEHNLTGDPRTS
jgi:hypothetical protein